MSLVEFHRFPTRQMAAEAAAQIREHGTGVESVAVALPTVMRPPGLPSRRTLEVTGL